MVLALNSLLMYRKLAQQQPKHRNQTNSVVRLLAPFTTTVRKALLKLSLSVSSHNNHVIIIDEITQQRLHDALPSKLRRLDEAQWQLIRDVWRFARQQRIGKAGHMSLFVTMLRTAPWSTLFRCDDVDAKRFLVRDVGLLIDVGVLVFEADSLLGGASYKTLRKKVKHRFDKAFKGISSMPPRATTFNSRTG
jgi:hypothetical protein